MRLSLWADPAPACGRAGTRLGWPGLWGVFSLCSLIPLSAPLAQASLGDDLYLAFGSFGSLGSHFCHGHPEPNTLPWVSFSVLSPVNLAQCILLPVSCSLLFPACLQLWGNTVLVVRGPAGEVRSRAPPAWAARSRAVLAPCPPVTARGLPLPASPLLSSLSCCHDYACCLACCGSPDPACA